EPAVEVEAEQTGEAAKPVEDARRVRATQERHHALQRLVIQVKVQTGVFVSQAHVGFPRETQSSLGRCHLTTEDGTQGTRTCRPPFWCASASSMPPARCRRLTSSVSST